MKHQQLHMHGKRERQPACSTGWICVRQKVLSTLATHLGPRPQVLVRKDSAAGVSGRVGTALLLLCLAAIACLRCALPRFARTAVRVLAAIARRTRCNPCARIASPPSTDSTTVARVFGSIRFFQGRSVSHVTCPFESATQGGKPRTCFLVLIHRLLAAELLIRDFIQGVHALSVQRNTA